MLDVKKFLCLLLSVVMLSSMSVTALAANTDTSEESDQLIALIDNIDMNDYQAVEENGVTVYILKDYLEQQLQNQQKPKTPVARASGGGGTSTGNEGAGRHCDLLGKSHKWSLVKIVPDGNGAQYVYRCSVCNNYDYRYR